LKLIEKFSPYHVLHEERSYPPFKLRSWFEKNNGKIIDQFYCDLVPIFSPDWFVKLLKILEPIVEKIPFLRQIGCAVFIFKISFKK
jgi:hypothetical protein